MNILRRLWIEEEGLIAFADVTLISTLLVIGTIVGAVTYRDALVQELGDLGMAIGFLNQSYGFSGSTVGVFSSPGSSYADRNDECVNLGTANQAPACMDLERPAANDG